jgi:A/G-specific adenine glycosylase
MTRLPRSRRLAAAVEEWFRAAQRPLPWRDRYAPYGIWIAEVMAQQTRIEVVVPRWSEFIARFPDLDALAGASEAAVLAAWSGLGYYRRARMLHAGARRIKEEHGGVIPRDRESLLRIPGIGRYTAGAIASIAFDDRAAIVDGNIARLLARVESIDAPAGTARFTTSVWASAEAIVQAAASPRILNQGLMELGATICRPSAPCCERCPIRRMCRARKEGRAEELPRRQGRRKSVALEIPLYLVRDAAGHLLMRRAAGGLMSGMLHLPHGSDALLVSDAERVAPCELLGRFSHTVTHRRIAFTLFRGELRDRLADDEYLVWIDPSDLPLHAHPSYVEKALALAAEFATPQ